jgi:tellurite resistance protein
MIAEYAELQSQVLSLVAWADGKVDAREMLFSKELIDGFRLSKAQQSKFHKTLDHKPNLESIIKRVKKCDQAVLMNTLKNAYLMAQSNGRFDVKEKRIINILAKASGITGKRKLEVLYRILHMFYLLQIAETDLLISIKTKK